MGLGCLPPEAMGLWRYDLLYSFILLYAPSFREETNHRFVIPLQHNS